MEVVTSTQMNRILEVTDSLSLHREAVVVPLGPEGNGDVKLVQVGQKIEITVPSRESVEFDSWITGLRERIESLDLSKVRKAD